MGSDNSMTEEKLDGAGGQIFVRSWRPSGTPGGIVAICHGFNSHSGQYLCAAGRFAAYGYAVYALDLRGRGRSDGERLQVEAIAQYVGDPASLIDIAKAREPWLPVFLLWHSAGGVISCTYALADQAGLAGLICESFAFKVPAPDFALAIVNGLSRIAPRVPALRLKNRDFSRYLAVVKALDDDPLTAR